MRTILTISIISLFLASTATAQDYFPLREGNQWIYTVSNGAQVTTTVAGFTEINGVKCAIVESAAQNDYMAVDTEGVKVYMTESGGLPVICNPPVTKIKLPFKQGQKWTSTINQEDLTLTSEFEAVGTEEVQTKAGNFKCIVISSKITIPGQGTITSESYYADRTGLVLQKVKLPGQTIITSLTSAKVKPTEKIGAPPKINISQERHCPNCGAVVNANAKYCPSCGTELPPVTAPPVPVEKPTVCPNCGAQLSEDSRYCPECGLKIGDPPQTAEIVVDPNAEKIIEKYVSDQGNLILYKPQNWQVIEQNLGMNTYSASIIRPDETALLVFMTYTAREDINDSLSLAGVCLSSFKDKIPDLEGKNVKSNPEKDRTTMDITFTEEGEKGIGHGYFFNTQNSGTVYLLLAREDVWKHTLPILTNIASNIAYSPEEIDKVIEKGEKIAAQTISAEGRVLNPAAMLQKAKNSAGKQMQLVQAELSDKSLALQIPKGWDVQGQGLRYSLTENPKNKDYGLSSESYTVVPSVINIPGTINSSYLPPPQALALVFRHNRFGTDLEILSEVRDEHIEPAIAKSFKLLRAEGFQVDSRLLYVKFKNIITNKILKGLFSVQCMSTSLNPDWQVFIDGSWASENEFEEWLPLYLRIRDTFEVGQQWKQFNINLQKSIADANQVFEQYVDSVRQVNRSMDYTSWMWNQTTLGQGTWIAGKEGAELIQTNSFGIQSSQGGDNPVYNIARFTGESPWTQEQLKLIDTQAEFEKYMRGN